MLIIEDTAFAEITVKDPAKIYICLQKELYTLTELKRKITRHQFSLIQNSETLIARSENAKQHKLV